MKKDLGSGFVVKAISKRGENTDIYDVVLYRDDKILLVINTNCYGSKSALYWFNISYIQLKKIIIMADTIKESKGTGDEQFFYDWLMELLKYWGIDNDLYKKLKQVVFDYLNN